MDKPRKGSWTSYVANECNGPDLYENVGQKHGHHIVMKKKAPEKSREILCKYGIDPYCGCENLCIARNWCHSNLYADKVQSLLEDADKTGKKSKIEEALRDAAKLFQACEFENKAQAEKEKVNVDTDE